ncbi:MAG: 2-oxoglutarate dehydrogenase E1 component [Akkermansiaceae bacterium]|nr:2-oxoglutarate dehydrogenase E1 component [Akkermansiaceae bacterium]
MGWAGEWAGCAVDASACGPYLDGLRAWPSRKCADPQVSVIPTTSISALATRLDPASLELQYARWRDDPGAVEPVWAAFFEGFELGRVRGDGPGTGSCGRDDGLSGRVCKLVGDFRRLGHCQARVNPLARTVEPHPELLAAVRAISPLDLERMVAVPDFQHGREMPVAELLAQLEACYGGGIGFDFMHLHDSEVLQWVRDRAEARPGGDPVDPERAADVLRWLLEAELFEQFLGRKFLGENRFSLEGAEGVLIVLNAILEDCPAAGVAEIEMGMSHRGRLNVLANFVRKTLSTIFHEFTAHYIPETAGGAGDVKYHLGYENHRDLADGRVRVSLAANPSHLEAVNAIIEGKARARQRLLGDDGTLTNRRRVLPLLIHGDAAFAGQGCVAEVLNLSQLSGYRTGGTIHLVINNQIGFTTTPADARTSLHATDVAKMIDAPILHVNGEEPMALYWAARFALEFRQTFGRDVVIDLVCYRRQGHSESDQAAFTQPLQAREIEVRESFGQVYQQQLVAAGLLDEDEARGIEETIWEKLEAGYQRMMELDAAGDRGGFTGTTAIIQPDYDHAPVPTGISREVFQQVGAALTRLPDGFTPHPALARRVIPNRIQTLAEGGPFDWAFAEALAFGSLLLEKTPVRLSGQDSRRGTFSQRHAVIYDYETRERHIPLNHLGPDQARFSVHNSPLSQFAVLGFDYGYSVACPSLLTLWESQFGDFANGAQTIIDQFIASAETKWQRPSDLVLLLPHGHEGMGPEHSSARLERFLQLCAADNLIVANCTTPAQYFHLLRRQKHRPFRKPLILMTPKGLLFRQEVVSSEADFLEGACFQEVLPDTLPCPDPAAVTQLVLCSGKVFFELAALRQEAGVTDTAILRIEQLYPFHREMLEAMMCPYPNVRRFVWCQEEPANMGAWSHLSPLLHAMTGQAVHYAGRSAAASPATGSRAVHLREQQELLVQALGIQSPPAAAIMQR